MGFLSRLFGAQARPAGDGDENLLVISDVHLGEDIVIEGPEHLGEYIRALNRELAGFVAAHRQALVDDRLWHLVINGDLFDFVKVSLRPEPEEAFRLWSQQQVDAKHIHTIPNTPDNVVWKLERIFEIHRPLFRELATFLLNGHRLTFVEGNHDAEFYFPEVRQALRQNLVQLAEQVWRRERHDNPMDRDDIEARIKFREWFEVSPGRYHIEHGHQYDEYCSFEYQLAPYDRQNSNTLATPLSHRAAPYFGEYAAEFTTRGLHETGFLYWARYALGRGPRVLWSLFKAYWLMVYDLIGLAGPRRRAERLTLRERHLERLRQLAHDSPYGFGTLELIDKLKATPAEYSRFKMYHGGYFDRFVIAAFMLVVALFAIFLPWGWAVLTLVTDLAVGLFAFWLLRRAGQVDLSGNLRRAAARIAEITGVRYVIFGHSHRPELVDLRRSFGVGKFGESAFYLNSGSWVTREILMGKKGEGMTYVEITGRGATLRRWLGREEEPVVLAASDPSAMPPAIRSQAPDHGADGPRPGLPP